MGSESDKHKSQMTNNTNDIVKDAYQRADVLDLERQALALYGSIETEKDKNALREILQKRKEILDSEFVFTEETAKWVKSFNDYLTRVILKAQKLCNEELARLMKECPERKPETRIEIGLGDLPELHPVQEWPCNDYDETLWDVITDTDIETLWDRWNDAFMTIEGTLEPFDEKKRLLGLESDDDTWADVCHFPSDWAEGIQLTMPFHQLQDHSYMSLYDFIFVNKLRVEGHYTFHISKLLLAHDE